jgi:hypothetical protein
MLQLFAALFLAAAPAPATPAKADPAPAAKPADAPAKANEQPLTEAEKKVVALAGMFDGISRDNLATYEDLLKVIADPKDCAASAKAVAERNKKHDADQAKMHAEADAFRKPMPQGDQQAAAGKALFTIMNELKAFRAKLAERDAAVATFKSKCPKEAPPVEKAFATLRKLLVP